MHRENSPAELEQDVLAEVGWSVETDADEGSHGGGGEGEEWCESGKLIVPTRGRGRRSTEHTEQDVLHFVSDLSCLITRYQE